MNKTTPQSQKTQNIRHIGAAEDFIDETLVLGRVAFSLDDLVKKSGLSDIAAKSQLRRLGSKVVRPSPRQPFFLIVGPEHRIMGAPPAIWWLQDYFNWLGQPYYLALQSAASSFGSNPQALQITQVMTAHPLRPIKVGRIQVRFFVKKNISQTPIQQLPQAPEPLNISTPESTTFDLIRYANRIGGIERATETILPLLPTLRARELKHVLEVENKPAVARQLDRIMKTAGEKNLDHIMTQWLSKL